MSRRYDACPACGHERLESRRRDTPREPRRPSARVVEWTCGLCLYEWRTSEARRLEELEPHF